MTPDPIVQFLDAVKRSGLITADVLQSCSDELKFSESGSQEDVAAKLVQKNLLTAYQVERLLAGQGEDCVLAGRYHILEKIGAGGMGNVFRALDTKLNRVVAVKLMTPHNLSDPDAVARFKREARALAQLALPNVVQAFDTGEDRGRNFLVMEYVQGLGLNQLVKDKGPVPPSVAADYIYQTAMGMLRAHERGLIHRDLKPANLLLTGEGEIKILDLGLARFLQDQIPDSELTQENIGMGTPDYMPPEQFRDAHNVDSRADIYSLGCTLYFLIAGQVPFPGSSFSEKVHAHETSEPLPLAERSPEIPAGLAMIVQRMMAKHPADRFQSMRAVAQALAPYVAGSSKSLPSVKLTVSWSGDALVSGRPPRQRASWPAWVGGGMAGVVLMVLLGYWTSGIWYRPASTNVGNQLAKDDDDGRSKVKKDAPGDNGNVGEKKKQPPPKPEGFSIPDGSTVAQDGSGDYKTINEALKNTGPGERILVLDDKTYQETIEFTDPVRHKGITLEAAKRATIQLPKTARRAVLIQGVSGVKIKGFRMRGTATADDPDYQFIVVKSGVAGVHLEDLEMRSEGYVKGIVMDNIACQSDQNAVVIRDCVIDAKYDGISILNAPGEKATSPVCRRIRIFDNRVSNTLRGIIIEGAVRDIQVTGNIVWNCPQGGIQIRDLAFQSNGILLANNTIFNNRANLQIWDDPPHDKLAAGQVTIQNNLLFDAAYVEAGFFRRPEGQNVNEPVMPSDGEFLIKLWNFAHNRRDFSGSAAKLGLPLSETDKKLTNVELLSRAPGDSDFLRPTEQSALASKGAGNTDPAFPTWIGAVPPKDAKPWNWKWTWDAHIHKMLTVSQAPKDGAQFDRINAALKKVKPGMTIRVLDDGKYRERVVLTKASLFSNITIEAVNNATLVVTKPDTALRIVDVDGVKIRGFRFLADNPNGLCAFVVVRGNSPGVVLENLHMEITGKGIYNGVEFWGNALEVGKEGHPIIVRGCRLVRPNVGLSISGVDLEKKDNDPRSASYGATLFLHPIIVHDNTIVDGYQGVVARGFLRDVFIAGNQFWGTGVSAVQLEHISTESNRILVANNTIFESKIGFRLYDTNVNGNDVKIVNNLLLAPKQTDMIFVDSGGHPIFPKGGGDGGKVIQTKGWRISHNWREMRTPPKNSELGKAWIPISASDVQRVPIIGIARTPNRGDFLRPDKDSRLAREGAGKEDASLPTYIGAVPPEGADAWNWDRTWELRMAKKKKSSE